MKRWDEIEKRLRGRKNVIGAEIGVERGETAKRLLALPEISTYYCIDNWRYDPAYAKIAKHKDTCPDYHRITFCIFLSHAHKWPGKVRIITAKSMDAVKLFDNEFFDFVFIDATHSYECVREDIIEWMPKIKLGGFLCGHDYGDPRFPGVKQAVDEMMSSGHHAIGPSIERGDDHTWFTDVL
ncbi:MAG: class I SAM-dependent methyltransferase [Candidatus Thorarchaeota archaeon]|jgi:hypothetical protein